MTKPKWENITVRLGDLRPWADNPRLSTKAQAQRIIKSFEKFGQVITVAVDPDLEVLDGHQRLSALLTIYGEDYKIDARQSDRKLELQERKELVINLHTGAVGSWDWSELANSWSAGDLQEWGMTKDVVKDWSNDIQNLKELLAAEVEPVDAEPQIDRAAELQEKWQTASGQLWKLGDHRLLIGDCTVRENVERLMGGEMAVMMFTDPPYNFQTEGGGALHEQYAKTAERIADIVDFDPSLFLEMLPVFFADRICAYVFCNKDLLPEYLVWAKSKKISFNLLVWKKPVSVPFGDSHRPDIEYLLLFRKGAKWNNGLQNVSYSRLLEYDNQRSDLHPTIKPLELVENQMKITSDKGDIIVEPFAGSGTTIIAAHNLNRRCFAMEISPNYGGVILERFATATGITPELVG